MILWLFVYVHKANCAVHFEDTWKSKTPSKQIMRVETTTALLPIESQTALLPIETQTFLLPIEKQTSLLRTET